MSDHVAVLTESLLPGLHVVVSSSEAGAMVVLTGELDVSTARQLDATLGTVWGALEIDCAELRFIDAAGIAVLVRASRRATSIRLERTSSMTRKLITILGLDSVFFGGEDPRPFVAVARGTRGADTSTTTNDRCSSGASDDRRRSMTLAFGRRDRRRCAA